MPEDLGVAGVFGLRRERKGEKGECSDHRGVVSFIFIMTHIDSVIQNIALVSSLLYSYWLSTSKSPTSSKSINHFFILHFT